MKKILICRAGSYIGGSFEQYMAQFGGEYSIYTLDMQDAAWREHSFSGYDCIYLVAGIAHRKETKENAHLYYEVNRDLAIEVAKRAKDAGVSQLIFLSSMSVYGVERGVITPATSPAPKSNYGRSKLEAEQGMAALCDENFKICTIRPPMVYGKGCRGNFGTVVALVRKLPFFPKVKNQRSMIYIDNLSLFVKLAIDRGLSGLYFPQNREYINTSEMAGIIAERLEKKCPRSALLGLCAKMAIPFVGMAKKAFGTLIYQDTEVLDFEYAVISSDEGVRRSL
jgi:UDP-glucose 4-epimerase